MDKLRSLLPKINLKKPWWLQDLFLRMKIFYGIMIFYFFIVSGIIYDVVEQPLFMKEMNGNGTNYFEMYRVHSQFIFEGLTCSYFVVQGSVGFILLDHIYTPSWTKNERISFIIGALYCIMSSYVLLSAACYGKSENYLTLRVYESYKWPLLEYKKFEGF